MIVVRQDKVGPITVWCGFDGIVHADVDPDECATRADAESVLAWVSKQRPDMLDIVVGRLIRVRRCFVPDAFDKCVAEIRRRFLVECQAGRFAQLAQLRRKWKAVS